MAALSRQVTEKDFRGPHSVVMKPLREEIAGKTQMALVVLLFTSAALMLIACVNLANLLISRGTARGREVAVRAAFVNAELESILAIPGVVHAGAISRIPLTPADPASFYLLAGQSEDRIPQQVALFRVVTRDYFPTIEARLREGRFFEISDRRSASPVAVVNESFASYWYTIIGIVKQIREVSIAEELRPAVYLLHEQADQWVTKGAQPSWIVVRTAVEPASIVSAVRQAIWSVDKNQPVWRVQTFEEIVHRQLSTPRQSTALMSAFALLALLLASIGLRSALLHRDTAHKRGRRAYGVRR